MPNKKKTEDNSNGGVNINASGDVIIHGNVIGRDLVYQIGDTSKRRNQLALLSKVKDYWIKGVYEKSIHSDILLNLNKELTPDKVQHQNPWDMILETPELGKQPVPSNKSLLQVFDELHHAMLILGAPGSGKTFTLLELANDAILRAEKNPIEPIPVVLNLSTWAEKRSSLDLWLIEELFFKYQVPRKLSKAWIEENSLCLLLDGLDEVIKEYRTACVDALNVFRIKHGLTPLVLCSRLEEYEALRTQLNLEGALQILPLTHEQIDGYLLETGVNELREDIKTDPELLKVVESPLMLNIASVAYHELSREVRETMPTLTAEKRRTIMFQSYVNAMFKRNTRTYQRTYKHQEIINKLSYLAKQMLTRGQSLFLVEELQPSIFSFSELALYTVTSRLFIGLFLWIASSILPLVLLFSFIFYSYPDEYINIFDPAAVGFLIITSLVNLLVVTWFIILGLIRFRRNIAYERLMSIPKKKPKYWVTLIVSLIVIGCPIASIMILIINTSIDTANLGSSIFATFVFIVPLILIMCLVFVFNNIGSNPNSDVLLVEVMRWSWRRGAIGFLISAVISIPLTLIVTLIAGATFALDTNQTLRLSNLGNVPWDLCITSISVPVGLFFGILNGIRGTYISLRSGVNYGVKRSLLNALLSAVIFGFYGFFSILLIVGISNNNSEFAILSYFKIEQVISFSLILVGISSITGFLLFGGVTVINHYTLRSILALKAHLPWKITSFLDYCVDRAFMRHVGGGYIFIHRYLMEYFASLYNKG